LCGNTRFLHEATTLPARFLSGAKSSDKTRALNSYDWLFFVQIGKVMDHSADFYSSRLPKKQRKATLADELLADADFKRYQKRK